MENLVVGATRYTPGIDFDFKADVLSIKGESYAENVADFYAPIISWIEKYLRLADDRNVMINLELLYFNSSSSKVLLDIFDLLETAAVEGKKITINWIYEQDDDTAYEFGEEFKEDFKSVFFHLIQKEEKSG